ncbi:HAD-IIB family hydrolase [Candidatus Woesearchaeota archaeon]|nr:HAD-IIB family hydrolase [Candidatus Woesearchaeota archaeon]
MQKIIFTDLDGTLLNHSTYSFKKAMPALKQIKKNKIPLIICTSKTKAEIEYYKKKLKNSHPFISENGGAIFIPKNYFNFDFKYNKKDKNYYIIELGTDYKKLLKTIKKIKDQGIKIVNFKNMSLKEISKDANLSLTKAKLAKKRGYDEPFKIIDKKDESKVIKIIKQNNLRFTRGGRYWHVIGNNNKGKAVNILQVLFKRQFKTIKTYAFGDSKNDFKMLDVVDESYLVQNPDRKYASKKYKKSKGIGPQGWNKIALKIAIKNNNKN